KLRAPSAVAHREPDAVICLGGGSARTLNLINPPCKPSPTAGFALATCCCAVAKASKRSRRATARSASSRTCARPPTPSPLRRRSHEQRAHLPPARRHRGTGGARMTDVAEILHDVGIRLSSTAPGKYSTTCPKCSAQRQPHHRRIRCLGVKIDEKGVCWHCNHCGWKGPEKKENSHAGEFAAIYDYRD